MIVLRALGVVAAVIVAGWFGLSAYQAHNVDAAEAILANPNSPNRAEAQHVRALLHSAGTLNPDREVDLLRGELASAEGNRRQAAAIFLNLTRLEPLNIEAWYGLANNTKNPHILNMALRQVGALAPDVKPKSHS